MARGSEGDHRCSADERFRATSQRSGIAPPPAVRTDGVASLPCFWATQIFLANKDASFPFP
eukprot:2107836-Alexandrium_andersonii.AAC.1